jgi:hypothetical protein
LIVSVEVAAEPDGVTDPPENAQMEFEGSPEQLSVTADAKPPAGVIVTVLVAEDPLATVAVAGESATLKSGVAAAVTVTDTALDTEELKPEAPP